MAELTIAGAGQRVVVGITGHRDLRAEDVLVLEERVRAFWVQVREANPGCDLLLLTPLAEGADRLVARVALELGVEVAALLPMSILEYEKDYGTEESLAEFRDLLGRSRQVIVIPLAPGATPENIQGWTEHRAKQYAYVGAYTVRYSHILLTLWDGVEPKLHGGTAEVVQYKLQGIPPEYEPEGDDVLPPCAGGFVYHIVTPRASNPQTVGEAYGVHVYRPE